MTGKNLMKANLSLLICSIFDSSFKLQWCLAQDLFGSQIPVTTGGFQLGASC